MHGEFPWVERVREVLRERGVRVPIHRKELIRALQIDWPAHGERPPETDPEWLLDYLAELGVVSVLTDGRVDVGDYLKGLHLERQGGVSRPRA